MKALKVRLPAKNVDRCYARTICVRTPKPQKLKHHCDAQHGGKVVANCNACRELSK